jgi:ParB/RepB/Spo0J family partition protein
VKAAMLAAADLRPHPSNVRDDLGDLTELAASIRAVGLLQPLLVRPHPAGGFLVQDGHRRLGALKLAGVQRAMCLIREAGDTGDDLALMVASAMHKQLSPLELASAFCALRNRGMGVPAIARATGYSTRTVGARLILLDLPEEAQDMVAERRLTLADAEDLARQLRTRPHASSRASSATKAAWLTKTHPLAGAVGRACTHGGSRVLIGGVGCGQCWEQTIRDTAVLQATAEAA